MVIKFSKGNNNMISKDIHKKFFSSKSYICIILVTIIFCCTGAFAYINNSSTYEENKTEPVYKQIKESKLYPVYKMKKDKVVFINKYGTPIFEIDNKEYGVIGEFNEGYIFLGKVIKSIHTGYEDFPNIPIIVRYSIFDSTGSYITTVKPDIFMYHPLEGKAIPFFYRGRARIVVAEQMDNDEIAEEIAETYDINIRGERLPDTYYVSINKDRKYFENVKIYYNQDATKYGYIHYDGIEITPPIYDVPSAGYDYWNPNFANGVALVKLNGKFGYINKKGEYIIKPTLEYAQSFSNQSVDYSSYGFAYLVHDLAYIVSDTREGYINTKGEFVWSIPKQQY